MINDAQWKVIGPVIPGKEPSPHGGRPRASDRECLDGILWVVRNGARWRDLPAKYPSPATCWRRLQDWEIAECWDKIWKTYLGTLSDNARNEWGKAIRSTKDFKRTQTGWNGLRGRRAFWLRTHKAYEEVAAKHK